jgi:hypothetical protein
MYKFETSMIYSYIYKVLLFTFIILILVSCKSESDINFNNYKYYEVDRNLNIEMNLKYNQLFLLCTKYNISISRYKSITQFSNRKISKIIKDLESNKYIKKTKNEITPKIFIADKYDVEKLFNLAENTSTKIAELITNDSLVIEKEFKKLKISEKVGFDIWKYLFIGNILIGQEQLNYISISISEYNIYSNKNDVRFSSLIENENPVLDIFHYNKYIAGTSANSVFEFGQFQQQLEKYWWNNNENIYIIPIEDNISLYYYSKKYSSKILPVLKLDIPRIKEYYNNSHFKNEIEFYVFYYWYYHFIYSKSINKLIEKNVIKKPENNFNYNRLNECG